MRPKLIIFDCDGVLVDSEAVANDCMARLFSNMGLPMTGPDCRQRFQGMMIEDVCREVAVLTNRPYDPALPAVVRENVENTLAAGVEPVPGAVELVLRVIANDIPYCVASSGSIGKMQLTLGNIGLLKVMEGLLFSAQDVERGKPHPDIYLAAAAAMNHRCEDAIVIEDSVTGVRAGVAAGARVLGYAGDPFTDTAALQDAGAEVFDDMGAVHGLIGLD